MEDRMSVMSLLSATSCADLKEMWQSVDFDRLGVTLDDGSNPASASGSLLFSGIAFSYALQACPAPAATHHIFCNADLTDIQSAVHIDLGPAVASGRIVPAIVQAMLELGDVLGRNLGIKAVFWSPADVVSGYDYYAEAVAQYAEGAAFPALLCVGFDMSTIAIVQTTGLAWLCDQELTFAYPQLPAHEAMRYVVRLVHDLATQGPYDRALELPGLHADEVVVVTPSPDQGTVNARLVVGKEAINSTR
ncbi:MAG TPA: hypothetical protein PLJ45_03200 [Sphingorhabdus sp.]|uniref:hypothetical protein n=1 Tax=Sphingorhabdus sp. TaxID=1902408 RepID=UPI002CE50F1F|nr:hypothetical protein [Sphingorhabdus sp.]HQS11910.1 hypothetical protein [Sphingorhabdus sp.]HQS79278.1 hypothetical protein [Sphingorhabdus sp.]